MPLIPPIYVLRLGHRPERDKRITTHVALVARAFGARGFFLAQDCDYNVINSLIKVEGIWGRGLEVISCLSSWRPLVIYWREMGWPVVHLTMYGRPLSEALDDIRRVTKPLLVVVGAEKVPREIFELASYNISITDQPHSEVAALAVFIDRIYNRLFINIQYRDAKRRIVPSDRGKMVLEGE